MYPEKLKDGDEIRVISPARSLSILSKEIRDSAVNRLNNLGFKITFSKHSEEVDEFESSTIQSRVEDMHDAFNDESTKAILTTLGGFNSNQLLRYLDYDLIKSKPKILCGYSDITALQNAIYSKTNLVTYSGPHFSRFGMLKGLEYTLQYFKKCLMDDNLIDVLSSESWSDDRWFEDQIKREFITNNGFSIINEGDAEGTIIGGNLCTFQLLHGTEYMPELSGAIIFIEDCVESNETFVQNFDRYLQSLIHQPQFEKVKGMVIGRFERASGMNDKKLTTIIRTKKELSRIPIIANVDFGHTTPQITFPIGGKVSLNANKNEVNLRILEH